MEAPSRAIHEEEERYRKIRKWERNEDSLGAMQKPPRNDTHTNHTNFELCSGLLDLRLRIHEEMCPDLFASLSFFIVT